MRDYTYNGLPVAQMATADIQDCLNDGFEIKDSAGHPAEYATKCVRERLELELFIRAGNLRSA